MTSNIHSQTCSTFQISEHLSATGCSLNLLSHQPPPVATDPLKINPRYAVSLRRISARPNIIQRRREQNRNAQRAYRERKEKYIKSLLKHIDDMNQNQVRLSESYETMRQEALRLQGQVEDLKSQLEIWSKAQVVLVKFPEDTVAEATGNTHAALLPGPQAISQVLDPLLGADIAYPGISV
jgi:hypothetical protein